MISSSNSHSEKEFDSCNFIKELKKSPEELLQSMVAYNNFKENCLKYKNQAYQENIFRKVEELDRILKDKLEVLKKDNRPIVIEYLKVGANNVMFIEEWLIDGIISSREIYKHYLAKSLGYSNYYQYKGWILKKFNIYITMDIELVNDISTDTIIEEKIVSDKDNYYDFWAWIDNIPIYEDKRVVGNDIDISIIAKTEQELFNEYYASSLKYSMKFDEWLYKEKRLEESIKYFKRNTSIPFSVAVRYLKNNTPLYIPYDMYVLYESKLVEKWIIVNMYLGNPVPIDTFMENSNNYSNYVAMNLKDKVSFEDFVKSIDEGWNYNISNANVSTYSSLLCLSLDVIEKIKSQVWKPKKNILRLYSLNIIKKKLPFVKATIADPLIMKLYKLINTTRYEDIIMIIILLNNMNFVRSQYNLYYPEYTEDFKYLSEPNIEGPLIDKAMDIINYYYGLYPNKKKYYELVALQIVDDNILPNILINTWKNISIGIIKRPSIVINNINKSDIIKERYYSNSIRQVEDSIYNDLIKIKNTDFTYPYTIKELMNHRIQFIREMSYDINKNIKILSGTGDNKLPKPTLPDYTYSEGIVSTIHSSDMEYSGDSWYSEEELEEQSYYEELEEYFIQRDKMKKEKEDKILNKIKSASINSSAIQNKIILNKNKKKEEKLKQALKKEKKEKELQLKKQKEEEKKQLIIASQQKSIKMAEQRKIMEKIALEEQHKKIEEKLREKNKKPIICMDIKLCEHTDL
jgi:hypothetical protein